MFLFQYECYCITLYVLYNVHMKRIYYKYTPYSQPFVDKYKEFHKYMFETCKTCKTCVAVCSSPCALVNIYTRSMYHVYIWNTSSKISFIIWIAIMFSLAHKSIISIVNSTKQGYSHIDCIYNHLDFWQTSPSNAVWIKDHKMQINIPLNIMISTSSTVYD